MAEVLQFSEFGGPERLRVVDVDDPPLAPDEVRYEVRAFALNRADLMFLAGEHYTVPQFPTRIGQEAAGVVTEVGSAVSRFQIGDRVSALPFHTLCHGNQGRTAVTPEDYLAPLTDGIDFIHGTSIWMQYLTAWFAFTEAADLKWGDTVLVRAAASSAGLGALQIAQLLGLKTVATIRTAAKRDLVLEHGANAVVIDGVDDLDAVSQEISLGRGFAASFDPIAGDSLFDYAHLLGPDAIVLGYGTLSDAQPVVPVAAMARVRARFHPYSMYNHVGDPHQRERAVAAISAALNGGQLSPLVDRVFEFADFAGAYEHMLSNQQSGKIVVQVEPPIEPADRA
ncbi:alcohol dehydrogenase catalytic domain-containing protein [Brevibacterium sp.]|uniref:alcohol dehydrogenase catalytic domain-containing protein n=1 Tax=Brevibacterium sp. TaxID=1701 RepID=UPI002811BF44|nr:zinc-binding dehydrogenase [Brevibacterium sp.]